MSAKPGRCEQVAPNKVPLLTAGEITPEALHAWEMGCLQFFRQKEIAAKDQVGRVAWNLQDPRVQDWYVNDSERLNALTFAAFMLEVRSYWLPSDWATMVRQKLLSSTQGDKAFHVWAAEVQSQNVLLRGNASHLSDDNLHYHLESHMNVDLIADYRSANVEAEQDLRKWIEKVRHLDEKRLHDVARQKEAVETALRANRQPLQTSRSMNTKSKESKMTGDKTTLTRLPRLTPEEQKLLNDNEGRYKCCQFFQTHTTPTCPNDFPDAKGYATLMAADVEAARTKKRTKLIAAVIEDQPVAKRVHAVEEVAEPIAVVMPSATLGSGTDTGDECIAPLSVPHFYWSCLIDGPNLASSLPVEALIDNGSHLVLIDTALVKKLGLRLYTLPKPLDVSVAMSPNECDTFSLSQYVRLSCLSLDCQFRSHSVRAIVTPRLCTPLLLGGPFLSINRIVIDHELRTCTNKDSGYDLLNPSLDRKDRNIVNELNCRLPMSEDYVAAIQCRIEQLACSKDLHRCDTSMKAEFADCFPVDIPPIEQLPDDVLFHVQPKDATKIIQRRSYDCPKKYREAWKTLLQQHIDAGCLHPSNSPHSSPAFIIPKADPTTLPHWVNDFRELNLNTVPDNHPLPKIDEIQHDCAKGRFFAKIDMTNAFFQTKVHPDDVKWLAVHTPWGLYEWLVMPMGVRNAPAVHQRRMACALRQFIGQICHVYLDDIVIWSQTLDEHIQNVRTILEALRAAKLFCSLKKTQLFCTEVLFLGHKVSAQGIEANPDKISCILDWPVPRSAKEMCSFLGLVRYIADHIPNLAEYTRILNALTTKAADLKFPSWSLVHQDAFQAIKDLVVSPQCLTTIDHDNLGDNQIFLTCDASDYRTGAVLS